MVCRCKNGTYGTHCCSTGSGGSSRSPSPGPTNYGSMTMGRAVHRAGRVVTNVGLTQYLGAHLAQPPPSQRIWRGMTKRQARTHAPHELKDGKKYDWRPRGDRPLDGIRDANLLDRDKFPMRGKGGVRQRHWDRMPEPGKIYSRTTEYDRRKYRRSQAQQGLAKTIGGTAMKTLGRGLTILYVGTYAHWLYKDPSLETLGDIAFDMIGGNDAAVYAKSIQGTYWHPGNY